MTVLEMPSATRPSVSWTEVCATGHTTVTSPSRTESITSPRQGRAHDDRRPSAERTVAPGRRVLARPAAGGGVRSCRVQAPADQPIVDDVPAWVLMTCGVVFGLVLLLAMVLIGGPSYA